MRGFSTSFPTLLLALLGGGGFWPMSTMLARLVEPEQRPRASGVNFMLAKLGIGLDTHLGKGCRKVRAQGVETLCPPDAVVEIGSDLKVLASIAPVL